jgi:decaprenylphospho-beta-D-erythro-pentofuranosid-2-ulose 2-reductase
MTSDHNDAGRGPRVLLLGGTSEIGLATLSALNLPSNAEVILAGRDEQRLADAAKTLNCGVRTELFDALDVGSHQGFIDGLFADGPLDLLIAATGVLAPQEELDQDVAAAATMIETNLTSHITTLLAAAGPQRAQRSGTIVVLSSVAAIRPRKFNPVYGATKAALDAFARGFADALHGSGVHVLLVRPGFVTGRMTAGMQTAPMATTPGAVGIAIAAALTRSGHTFTPKRSVVWVPPQLAAFSTALRLVPRPIWRRISR